jgi:hypothetical protein
MTPWTGYQPVARPLPTQRTAQTQNKPTHTSMPRVGFVPTIPAFERAKTVHALDRAATVIGSSCNYWSKAEEKKKSENIMRPQAVVISILVQWLEVLSWADWWLQEELKSCWREGRQILESDWEVKDSCEGSRGFNCSQLNILCKCKWCVPGFAWWWQMIKEFMTSANKPWHHFLNSTYIRSLGGVERITFSESNNLRVFSLGWGL